MPFHKGLGSNRSTDIKRFRISNSDMLHSSRHRKVGTRKAKKR